MLYVPWGVAQVTNVFSASEVQCPPERLPRDTGDQIATTNTMQFFESKLRIFEMFQNFTAHNQIRTVPPRLEIKDAVSTKLGAYIRGCEPSMRLLDYFGRDVERC